MAGNTHRAALFPLVFSIFFAFLAPVFAALQNAVYQTSPVGIVREWGDRVPGNSRFVPLFATLTFDLQHSPPSFTGVITNAVLEGGNPFALTVRSSSGSRSPDGTYSFHGDYLGEIYPAGTQYLFDWHFSTTTNGGVIWDGTTYWSGGHLWFVNVTNLSMVLQPVLNISQEAGASVRIMWPTNFSDHVLESVTSLQSLSWGPVTNVPVTVGDQLSVTLTMETSECFYRLRKP